MRSTNLVIFLVLLNAAAGISAAVAPAQVSVATGGGDVIEGSSSDLQDRSVNQPSSDEITGSFFGIGSIIQTIDGIIFAGPNMLQNLGLPGIIADGFKTVLVIIVAFDVGEAVTGRVLS
jgi:hypothetical protein